jgi:hypothetical protein
MTPRHKRHHKQIDYEEHESVLPIRFHKTSDWDKSIVDIMKINITDNNIFDIKHDHVDPLNISDDEWKGQIDIKSLVLSPEYKTLARELKRVYDSNNNLAEHYIDTYIDTLLHILEFNHYPLSINLQHRFEIKVGDEVYLTSIPDFVVMSEESRMLIVVEDKNTKNASNFNQWKENQIMGEIFTATHAMKIEKDINIYAVRVIGTLFTFYKAMITLDYISDTAGPKVPLNYGISVYRYPSPGNLPYTIKALDICKVNDRTIILEYMNLIKNEFH